MDAGQGKLAGLRTADLRFTLEAWAAVVPGRLFEWSAWSGGSARVQVAEAAENGESLGAVVRGHVRERLLDRHTGVGQVRTVRSRSRARPQERAVPSAGCAAIGAILLYQAGVVLPIAGLTGRDGRRKAEGQSVLSVRDAGRLTRGDRGRRDRCCLWSAAIAAHIPDSCRHQEQQTTRQRSTCSTASCGGGADIGRTGPCRAGLDAGRCNPACPCLRPARPERRRV